MIQQFNHLIFKSSNHLILFPVLFFMINLSVMAQKNVAAEEVLVLDKIETPSFIVSFEYDEHGRVASETRDGLGDEYLYYTFEYEYDENGNIVHLTKNGTYIIHQEENLYNADNQITVKNVYEDYGSGYKYVEQYLYTYQDALLQTILKQLISPNGPVNSTKKEFSYNKEQQLVQITQQDWVMGDWIHTETFDLEYNEFRNLLHYANEILQWEGVFAKTWRYVFHYNEDGELTERAYHNAMGEGWNSRPNRQYFYFYETLTEDETILYPNIYQFDELNFNWFQSGNKLVMDSLWVADCSGNINFIESANYTYKTIDININESVDDYEKGVSVLVYPNPTTGQLTMNNEQLTINNVEIFDMYGKKHHLITSSSNHQINISNFPTGIYFIKIETDKAIITKKILKY